MHARMFCHQIYSKIQLTFYQELLVFVNSLPAMHPVAHIFPRGLPCIGTFPMSLA